MKLEFFGHLGLRQPQSPPSQAERFMRGERRDRRKKLDLLLPALGSLINGCLIRCSCNPGLEASDYASVIDSILVGSCLIEAGLERVVNFTAQ